MNNRDTIINVLNEIASDKADANRADYWALICGEAAVLLKEDERAIKFQSDRLDELLKVQEPVEPKVDIDTYICGNCGHKLEHQELLGDNILFHEQYEYCPNCGKRVRHE